ncbi:MAG: Asp-tRNA(Asn)/Glu-tRNA(Gln) amidotransferase subunit GatC [Candidatus Paceibacterota bacterium]|jgi:aspartyl-tRNA(Asn)/glutamyl-tRNA(Gln) amidotransferase subunit C
MITEQDIDKLANLARIALTPEEKQKFQKDLESILGYISELKDAPLSTEEPAAGDYYLTNVLRADDQAFSAGEQTDKILAEAPKADKNFFVVKQILNNE